jgi:hypothetical protein
MQKRTHLHGSDGERTPGGPTTSRRVKLPVKLPAHLLARYQAWAQSRGVTFTDWVATACANLYTGERARGQIEEFADLIRTMGVKVEDGDEETEAKREGHGGKRQAAGEQSRT